MSDATGRSQPGTVPPGTNSEAEAARWVRRMFSGLAPRYDRINHLLSLNIDRSWRKELARVMKPVLVAPKARCLDLCCGTGDVLLEFAAVGGRYLIGVDFSHPMLLAARSKASRCGARVKFIEADALVLPFADAAFDAISTAFGFRNLANYEAGLRELHRVLKPGGVGAILEFSQPRGLAM